MIKMNFFKKYMVVFTLFVLITLATVVYNLLLGIILLFLFSVFITKILKDSDSGFIFIVTVIFTSFIFIPMFANHYKYDTVKEIEVKVNYVNNDIILLDNELLKTEYNKDIELLSYKIKQENSTKVYMITELVYAKNWSRVLTQKVNKLYLTEKEYEHYKLSK